MAGLTTLDGETFPWVERYYDDDLATGLNDGTSEANAWQSLADMAAGVKGGQRVNMKQTASPVVLAANFTWPIGGTGPGPIWFRGYKTTIGDGFKWQGDSSTFNFAADVGVQIWSDCSFDGSSINYTFLINVDDQCYFYNCDFSSDTAGEAVFSDQACFVGCTFTNSGTFSVTGYEAVTGDGKFVGCKFVGKGNCVSLATGDSEGILLFKCTAWAEGGNGDAIRISPGHNESAGCSMLECSAYEDGTLLRSAFHMNTWNSSWEAGGVWANLVTYGADTSFENGHATRDHFNLLHLYEGGAVTEAYHDWSNFEDIIIKDTAGSLTGDPFTSKATGDFSLNATAGAGALMRDGVDLGPTWGAAGERFASACDVGGVRNGTDDGGEPDSLVASSQQTGGGLNPWDMGIPGLTKSSELA
jgi:hypothetical protein